VTVQASEVALPEPAGKFMQLAFTCDRPVIAEPRFACDAGRFSARGGPTGSLDMLVRAEFRSDTGVTTFSGKGVKIAGTTASSMDASTIMAGRCAAPRARRKCRRCASLSRPGSLARRYHRRRPVRIEGELGDAGKGLIADVSAALEARGSHQRGQHHRHRQAGSHGAPACRPQGADTHLQVEVQGKSGQLLALPVYFDFGANPLAFECVARSAGTCSPSIRCN
jgi:hypothetical protein